MAFSLGVLLFALGIAVSIALHEAGHMWAARATGMRVRRFFVGFGPTLWSFHRGHRRDATQSTEYGIKLVPLGGFCDIAGMTKLDEMTEAERPHAMYLKPARSRILVLLGGIIMNVLLALAIIYGVALTWGLPDRNPTFAATVKSLECAPSAQREDGTLTSCTGKGPAERSGVKPGDTFISVGKTDIKEFPDLVATLRQEVTSRVEAVTSAGRTKPTTVVIPAVVQRGDTQVPLSLRVAVVERLNRDGEPFTTGAIGIRAQTPQVQLQHYDALTAVPGAFTFAGGMISDTWNGLLGLPQRFPGVVSAIFGGERAIDSPMSVVGASRVGGELVHHNQWLSFFLALASLNLFLAAFNLVPLPPLDGGHIAVVLWEKIRDGIRRLRGLPPAGPADYTKLMPITYAATALLLVFGMTVIVADIVNPIRIFGP